MACSRGRERRGAVQRRVDFPAKLFVAFGSREAKAEPARAVRDAGAAVPREAWKADAKCAAPDRRVRKVTPLERAWFDDRVALPGRGLIDLVVDDADEPRGRLT